MTNHHPHFLGLALALSAMACNKPPNTPDIVITPEDAGTNDPLVAAATSLDPDGDKVDLTYQWFLDGEIQADLTSDTVPADRTSKADQWTVEVTPTDGKTPGPTGSASIVILNTVPSGTVQITPDPARSIDDLTASGTAEDPDGDDVSWTWTWTRDGETTGLTDATLLATHTARDETWEVIGIAFDGEDSSEPIRRSIVIGNGPPTIDSLAITPIPATRASDLVAAVEATDPDGDALTFTYAWTIDGVPAIGASGSQLPTALFSRGSQVQVEVTPNDGRQTGAPVISEMVTVANAIPTILAVDLTPSPLREDSTVQCTPSGWSDGDGDTESYTWAWSVNGFDIGVSEPTLNGDDFDRGDTVSCTATPSDGIDVGMPVTSPVTTVENSPPVLDSAELNDTTPGAEDTLTVSLGDSRDADGDPIAFNYEWFVNDVSVSTDPTLPGGTLGAGDLVRCEVTPFDGQSDGVTQVTSEVEVGNTAPLVLSVAYEPERPGTTTDLVAVPTGFDADDDTLTYSFRWRVNGASIIDVTTDTLPADRFERDDVISLVVTPNDGSANGAPFTADDVTIGNTAPTVASARLEPDPVTESTGIECVPEGYDDPDGDTPAYRYEWTANSIVVGDDSPMLTGDWYDKGDIVVCTVTPTDGTADGPLVPSTPATVQNALPTIAGALIDTTDPAEGDTIGVDLVGLADADPADQANLGVFYEWFVNDVSVATTPTLDSTAFASGDLVHAAVRPFDGAELGTEVITPAVLVSNSAPAVVEVLVGPEAPTTTTPLVASATVSDPDADETTLTYAWFVEGEEVFGETGDTLDPSHFVKGESVWARAVANDGELDSPPVTSTPITILNTPPEPPVVQINPRWAMAEVDDLVCSIIERSEDVDNDNVTYAFNWFRDDAPYATPGTTRLPGDTIPAADVLEGTSWRCEASGVDITDAGEPGVAEASALVFQLRQPSANNDYTCAIDTTNHLRCWGLSGAPDGMGAYPDGEFRQVSAGFGDACAIAMDGTLSCWGEATALLSPPPGEFQSVAVGTSHACAIGANGIANCWGDNSSGQSTPPIAINRHITTGLLHTCAIDEDAAIQCWGNNNFGQLDAPEGEFDAISAAGFFTCALERGGALRCWGGQTDPAPEGNFVAVDAGALHACAITPEGEAVCWGDASSQSLSPPPGPFAQLAAGVSHTCGVRTDGSITCWGDGSAGETQPPTLSLVSVGPGYQHTCGVDGDGLAVCWGNDTAGQSTPPVLPGQALEVVAGASHSCALAGLSTAACWGDASLGQLMAPTSTFDVLTAGRDHTCGLSTTGDIECWGDNTWLQNFPPVSGAPWQDVAAGEHHTCGIDVTGGLRCWGRDRSDVLMPPAGIFTDLATGAQHGCAIDDGGFIACWGNDSLGQATPPTDDGWVQVATGTTHSCALNDLGEVSCWGASAESRLDVPPGVWMSIEANAEHTCGLRDDGTTACWGRYLH